MSTNYRKYKKGDTVRVTGFQGRLFANGYKRTLLAGVEFGVECVLTKGEDEGGDVQVQAGIIHEGEEYISVACIELVNPVEENAARIEHAEHYSLFIVHSADETQFVAKIWYDGGLPKEAAEKFANDIKAVYDSANQA